MYFLTLCTVLAPMKDAASIQKIFFQLFTMQWCILQTLSIFIIRYCSKIQYNTPIFDNFSGAAIVQERPLLARLR